MIVSYPEYTLIRTYLWAGFLKYLALIKNWSPYKMASPLCHFLDYMCFYINRLLDLLADRKDKSGRSGKVLVNGQRRPAHYKTTVGYVVQVN